MHETPLLWVTQQHPEVDVNGSFGPMAASDTKGGKQTFVAPAWVCGLSRVSSHSFDWQRQKYLVWFIGDSEQSLCSITD